MATVYLAVEFVHIFLLVFFGDNVDESGPTEPKQRKCSSRGLYCAVGGCKSQKGDGYTLHTFPKDEKHRRKWIHFVQTGRVNFGPADGTPTISSGICHLHFTSDCFML